MSDDLNKLKARDLQTAAIVADADEDNLEHFPWVGHRGWGRKRNPTQNYRAFLVALAAIEHPDRRCSQDTILLRLGWNRQAFYKRLREYRKWCELKREQLPAHQQPDVIKAVNKDLGKNPEGASFP